MRLILVRFNSEKVIDSNSHVAFDGYERIQMICAANKSSPLYSLPLTERGPLLNRSLQLIPYKQSKAGLFMTG